MERGNSNKTNKRLWILLMMFLSFLYAFSGITNSSLFRNVLSSNGRSWQAINNFWENVLNFIGEDPITIWVVMPNVITFVVYWTYGGLYAFMDITGKPHFMMKYKTQSVPAIDINKIKTAVKLVLFNQLVVSTSATVVFYKLMIILNRVPALRPVPPLYMFPVYFVACVLGQEVTYYYLHRLLHSRRIYKYIHKKHHEWSAPIAIMSSYCHPVEQVIGNMLPTIAGISITGCHALPAWLWLFYVMATTLNEHSGYHIPFFSNPEFHDYHHSSFTSCFGMMGLCDWIHGTDESFKKSKSCLRNRRLYSLKSMRELYPD